MTSMRIRIVALLVFVAAASIRLVPSAQPPAQQGPDYNAYYQIGPDSLPHEGVPKGEVRGPFVLPSQAYPGTQHTYWVYVPAQYDRATAASLMIFQDGQAFKDMNGVVRAPNVLDNLIYRREIPVMIAVFINPGRTPEQPEPTPSNWGDRDTNRPTEYNTLDDKYARVIVDELMPALHKEYNISKDPDRHGIGGASSGAIAAFTVAWQRPNDFRKVLSIVGSFVNLRGGDAYADIVRQSEKKPIRIFLQDGRNDNRGVGRGGVYDQRRDWFYQNVRLMQALTDKGYDVNYTWGINTHGQRMGGPILPEMMRWLWRDHPVSTDVNDAVERSFNAPKKPSQEPAAGTAGGGLVGPLKEDASDQIVSWVDGQVVSDWAAEITKRERAIDGYLNDTDPARAEKYGFRSGQNPRLAWSWFRNNPVGFNGVPFVLLKTIFDLDPNHQNPALRAIARIWKREATVRAAPGTSATAWTLDHIGVGPDPSDYVDGVARPVSERQSPLPFGFAFENPRSFEPLSSTERAAHDARLLARRVFQNSGLLIAKARTADKEENWERDRPGFGSPGTLDRVFLSCAACHVGRVMVSGKMKFLAGMPNTEIEAQYYSKLLMLTGAALVESGFDPASTTPVNPASIKPNTSAVRALYSEVLDKARLRPDTLYGSAPAQIARAKIQALAVAAEFPSAIQDLIAVGVKTHFIYQVVARNNAYKQPLPDVFGDRPGQMDAFGVASGLVAIHTRRKDNSFLEFVRRDNPDSPFFSGFSKANGLPVDVPGMTDRTTDARVAADRIFKNIPAWAPPVPAPIDIKSVNWATERYHANWDGNQGASSRTLASGSSATGDPRMVNVRIHEPLNPFIDNLPPPPYPFTTVDLARAREGKGLFKTHCATCHTPRNQTIYKASALGVDPNRTLLNTSVSRFGLAALVMEACSIYGLNNQGQPGADWCMPKGDWQAKLDEYFRDTPRRVAEGTNGYKADMLRGIWAQAPYLHNGSIPTLGQLVCSATRPQRFLRGNLNYDEALVGFEWLDRPKLRYAPNETILVKEFDTTVPGKANTGHTYGAALCPDTAGLDPIADRKEIETRLLRSPVGALLAFLKTL